MQQQQSPDPIQVEVFRAGDYGPRGVYTDADLQAIAGDYDPATHEAPVTLDHHQTGPAHGWVTGLQVLGGRLVATLGRLSPTLVESLKGHAFRKRSIELYRRFSETGRPYLKAVSFLGAAAPAVKGLADPVFEEQEPEVVQFDEAIRYGGDRARNELVRRDAWNPAWDAAGLLAIFEALSQEEGEVLVGVLSEGNAPVAFGAAPVESDPRFASFSSDVVGGSSAASVERHRAALEAMRIDPGTTYRDALLALR